MASSWQGSVAVWLLIRAGISAAAEPVDMVPPFPSEAQVASWPSFDVDDHEIRAELIRIRRSINGRVRVLQRERDPRVDALRGSLAGTLYFWAPDQPGSWPMPGDCVIALSHVDEVWTVSGPTSCGQRPLQTAVLTQGPGSTGRGWTRQGADSFISSTAWSSAGGLAGAMLALNTPERLGRVHGTRISEPRLAFAPVGMAVGGSFGALAGSPRTAGKTAPAVVTVAALGVAGVAAGQQLARVDEATGITLFLFGNLLAGAGPPVLGAIGTNRAVHRDRAVAAERAESQDPDP